MTTDDLGHEGWGLPSQSRKWHYFVDTRSLCGKWGFFQGGLEQGNDNSPSNCAKCKQRLRQRNSTAA